MDLALLLVFAAQLSVTDRPWPALLWGGYALGWLVACPPRSWSPTSTFSGSGRRTGPYQPPLRETLLYARIRRPMMVGLLLAFWVTLPMTAAHLVFAVAAAGYIAVGIRLEERALRVELGQAYADYAERYRGSCRYRSAVVS